MVTDLLYALIGVSAGILGGLFGIGGGIIVIPALTYLFGFSQHKAQGTSIAFLVLPVGLLGAIQYYKNNQIDFRAAAFLAVGFFAASIVGARYAIKVSDPILKRMFGIFLLLVSIKYIFDSFHQEPR